MYILSAFLSLCILAGNVYATSPEGGVKIVRITPEGNNTYEADQIVLEFDHDMVPLGDAAVKEEDLPIQISPTIKCDWRWLNTKTLACQVHHETQLTKATKYKVTIKPTLKSADGHVLDKEYVHEFTTSLPAYSYVSFVQWKNPTKPVFRVHFNQPVSQESVAQSLAIENVTNANKTYKCVVSKPPHEEYEEEEEFKGKDISKAWNIEVKQNLEQGTEYRLVAYPGLISSLGKEPSAKKEEIRTFKTFDEFKFLKLSCMGNDDKELTITPNSPMPEGKRCNPMAPIRLLFSAPISHQQITKNFVITPDPTGGQQEEKFWNVNGDYYRSHLTDWAEEEYRIFIPRGLKAASDYKISVKAPQKSFFGRIKSFIWGWFQDQPQTDLEDEFGRKLQNSFEITLPIDHRKPNFEIPNKIAILEKNADSEVPLYVNNLKKATFTYHGFNSAGAIEKTTHTYDIPSVQDIQFAIPFNIREMLKGMSGALYGALEADPSVDKGDNNNILFAQVTPYQIYVKVGQFNTTAWVTDLATGQPVANAKVTIYKDNLKDLALPKDILDMGETNEMGVATLLGTSDIDPKQSMIDVWGDKNDKIVIRVDKENELGIIPLTYDFKLDTWRASGESFWAGNRRKYQHVLAWGTTAQGIYRVGDTIQYKIYIRNQNNRHFTVPPHGKYDLELIDPTGKVINQWEDIKLNEFGSFSGEYLLPKNAPIGWYDFRIKAYMPDMVEESKVEKDAQEKPKLLPTIEFNPMRVLVSDFTPSPFKVVTDVHGTTFKPDQDLEALVTAQMHAGGAYTDAKAQITMVLDGMTFHSNHPVATNFTFGKYTMDHKTHMIFQNTGVVNNKGEFEAKIKVPSHPIGYGKMTIEGAVYDDRGRSVTSRSVVDYFTGEALIGLQPKEWLYTVNKPAVINYIIVNTKGDPVKGMTGDIVVERKDTSAAKVKTAGNAYKTNEHNEWVEVAKQMVTSGEGVETFQFTPPQAGVYRITASTKDKSGAVQISEIQVYVTGENFVVWGEETDNYLPLIPEKKDYQVGETARILVKNPVPHAKAWITIERFGVIDSFVQELDTNTPVIEFPVKEDYLPNFYVSVVMMAPRSDNSPLKVGQLDMGKPVCRIGYTALTVHDPFKTIEIKAKSDKEVYKPREKVILTLEAKVKHPTPQGGPLELAVVVLDDAVFDMIQGGKSYYDPYTGLYKKEELDISNYSLLTNIVGRQKFEKKGANPGGDGGASLSMRNIFKFVSYWNPSLITDKNGQATVEFEAPDNLTGWRVFVLGATTMDRFGLGEAEFKVNRPTEVRPIMPNVVHEGDQFRAGFSVMNRTDKSRTIQVHMEAQGNGVKSDKPLLHEETVTLEPFKRTTVYMPIETTTIPYHEEGTISFKVTAGDALDTDMTEHKVPVKAIRVMDAMAVSASLTDHSYTLPLAIPSNIHTDVGGIKLTLSPSLIGEMKGAFDYMKTYPYICWEQKLSKAVLASYYQNLKIYLPEDFDWPESKDIPTDTLAVMAQFQAGNGGMSYFLADDKYTDPYLSAFTALALTWLADNGHVINEKLQEKLHTYLDTLLRYDFPQQYYQGELAATTRAVILDALSTKNKVTKDDLIRFKSHWPKMSVFGKASFINAAMRIPEAHDMIEELVKEILSNFNESSGKFSLAVSYPDTFARILATPLRDTCAVLETMSRYAGTSLQAKNFVGDKAEKLVRSVIESRKGKSWLNTQENLFCARALSSYSKAFESTKPDFTVNSKVDDQPMGEAQFTDLRDKPITLTKKYTDQDVGKKTDLIVEKKGEGIVYLTSLLEYASKEPLLKPVVAGMEINREYSLINGDKWTLLKEGDELKRGDIVRIDLYLIAPSDRNYVVINDPVPGGFEPINQNFSTSSTLATAKVDNKPGEGSYYHQVKDWVEFLSIFTGFYHEEIRHDVVRYYSDFLTRGNYHLSYTAQVIADGKFTAKPAFAEEMYNPDIYTRGEERTIKINADK